MGSSKTPGFSYARHVKTEFYTARGLQHPFRWKAVAGGGTPQASSARAAVQQHYDITQTRGRRRRGDAGDAASAATAAEAAAAAAAGAASAAARAAAAAAAAAPTVAAHATQTAAVAQFYQATQTTVKVARRATQTAPPARGDAGTQTASTDVPSETLVQQAAKIKAGYGLDPSLSAGATIGAAFASLTLPERAALLLGRLPPTA